MSLYSIEIGVHKYFGFLLDDFGFSIAEELYRQEMGNAVVVFSKNQTCIELVKDRGQILVTLGDKSLTKWDWIEFAKAVQFFLENSDSVYSFPSEYNDVTEELQLSHLSTLMKLHCTAILSGEMSVVQLRYVILSKRAQ